MDTIKTENISFISVGIILGFIVGSIISIHNITANQYARFKMYRSIAYSLQKSLNKWIAIAFIVSLIITAIVIISFKLIKVLLRSRWKSYIAGVLEIHLRDKYKAKIMLRSFMFCLLFLLISGWAVNRFWLPFLFHPISLLGDVGVFIVALFLGWSLTNVKWKRVFNVTGLSLIMLLISYNIFLSINGKMSSPKGPNVILIIIDTLRADHVGCYGYQRNTSPRIDEFSEDSVIFKNAIASAPWTTPSIANIFTSKYPAEMGFKDEPVVLKDSLLTLTEIFKENRYRTKGIISHAFISSELGFDQGFDSYDEENSKGHGYISSPSIAQKAITFLEKNRNNKFFLFLHFFDPHYDFILHEKYNYFPDYDGFLYSGQPIDKLRNRAHNMSPDDIRYIKALYDSEISFTDEFIGSIFDKLKEMDLYRDSLIILTADHGEEFAEREDFWIGHGTKLYQELIHVPLVIKLSKNKIKKTIDEYIGLIDLMPTIVDLVGIRLPREYKHDGKIVSLDKDEELTNNIIISETQILAPLQSVIWKGWKYIYDKEINFKKLFSLKNDPAELQNVIAENEEISNTLDEILHKWNGYIQSELKHSEVNKPKFTEEQKEILRSLGYIK